MMIEQSKLWAVVAVGAILLAVSSRADQPDAKGAGWYVRPPVTTAASFGPYTSQLECIVIAKAQTIAEDIPGSVYTCSYQSQALAGLTGEKK